MIRRTSNAINQQHDQPNNWATSTPHNQRYGDYYFKIHNWDIRSSNIAHVSHIYGCIVSKWLLLTIVIE